MTITARIRVLDVDLDAFPAALEGLDGYAAVQALIRLHGTPLGTVRLPVQGGRCSGDALREAVLRDLQWPITQHLLADALAAAPPSTGPACQSGPTGLDLEAVVRAPHPQRHGRQPMVTVAVCTRDRTADLEVCLEGLSRLQYPHLELLVVDNAPTNDDTERLVRAQYP
ncbi:MAG: glycosyltransferase family 2 protein, partial [Chloroflexota bacterium]|nr:glycosyltransferase family 2 protein [Chloroflexota bacterium]